jgi:membrane-associated protein
VLGGVLWIGLLTLMGYLFGNLPFVQKHYETVILAIIGLSVLPMVVELIRQRLNKPAA